MLVQSVPHITTPPTNNKRPFGAKQIPTINLYYYYILCIYIMCILLFVMYILVFIIIVLHVEA